MKIYIILGTDGDSTWIQDVFKAKESADTYCKNQNKLSELSKLHSFFVQEWEVVE